VTGNFYPIRNGHDDWDAYKKYNETLDQEDIESGYQDAAIFAPIDIVLVNAQMSGDGARHSEFDQHEISGELCDEGP
jgi:hypothetical protein